MLTGLQIFNLKSLKKTQNLDIKPITFLVGPNSSGKSSFFQSILLLRQTIRNKDQKSALVLQDYIDLGSFKDIVWNHDLKNAIKIKLSDSRNNFEIEFGFQKENESIFVKRFRNFGVYGEKEYGFNFDYEVFEKGGKFFLKIFNYKFLTNIKFEVKFSKFYKIDQEELMKEIITKNRKRLKNLDVFRDIEDDKSGKKDSRNKSKKDKEFEILIQAVDLNSFIMNQTLQIEKLLNDIFHIGPLRREPQRVYTASGAFPSEVGKYGEWVVDELISDDKTRKKVKKWLKDFCIASDFKVQELRKGSKRYEIIIKEFNTGIWTNLADIGFGASQILPIIVEGFITKDSTILIEQPEIHLHPKAQATMGDLLLDIAKKNKNAIVVETHSDLIISRLCTRIAQGEFPNTDVAIYFFNPTENGTEIIDISVNKNGQFQNFPKGFFEERYEEALLKAESIF